MKTLVLAVVVFAVAGCTSGPPASLSPFVPTASPSPVDQPGTPSPGPTQTATPVITASPVAIDVAAQLDALVLPFRKAVRRVRDLQGEAIDAGDVEAFRERVQEERALYVGLEQSLRQLPFPPALAEPVAALRAEIGLSVAFLDELATVATTSEVEAYGEQERRAAHDLAVAVNAVRAALGVAPLGALEEAPSPPPAEGEIVLDYDFSEPEIGWPEQAPTYTYDDGAFVITVSSELAYADTREFLPALENVSIEAQIVKGTSAEGFMGLRCRWDSSTGDGYYAQFDVDGSWTIFGLDNEQFAELDRGFAPLFVAPGNSPNLVRLDCRGPAGGETRLSFYLNGHLVGEAVDEQGFDAGAVALAAEVAPAQSPLATRFEHLVIRELP